MLVTCPNCNSRYQVPDQTIGMKGRTVRCFRCQHQWMQPFVAAQPEARAKRPEARMVMEPPRPPRPEPVMVPMPTREREPDPDPEYEDDLLAAAMRHEESGSASGDPDVDEGNPFDRIAEMMAEQPPAPIPDMFANAGMERRPRRRGTLALIVVAVILVLAVLAVGAYYLQDRLIMKVPQAEKVFEKAGLRNETPGAGLDFQSYTADRATQDGHEVLLVRGLIVNSTDAAREIPPLRLVLYDGQSPVQEKQFDPPQAKIDPKASVPFKIGLDLPDAHATRFEITFGGGNKTAPAAPAANEPPK